MPPKLYGTEHIVYIVLFFVALAAAVLVTKFALKTGKSKTVFLKCVAGVVFVAILANRISLAVWHDNAVWLLPNSYCGMTSLLLSVFVLFGKPHNRTFDFFFWMESIGGIACVFYPYFIGQGPTVSFVPTFSGLIHHAVGFILCVLLVMCKWFSPSLKMWKAFPIGMCAYTVYGLFLLDVCGMTEAMQIDAPIIAGTPLKWWFILIVGTALVIAVLFCIEKIRKIIAKKSAAPAPTQEVAASEGAGEEAN